MQPAQRTACMQLGCACRSLQPVTRPYMLGTKREAGVPFALLQLCDDTVHTLKVDDPKRQVYVAITHDS